MSDPPPSSIAHPGRMRPSGSVVEIEVPAAARATSTLDRVDYADCFLVAAGSVPLDTAEQWARTVLEDAPPSTRRALQLGWVSLGLQLGPERSERHVLGWDIRRNLPDEILLGAASPLGLAGELLFQRLPDGLRYATFVRLETPEAHASWARIEPAHRQIAPKLLRGSRPEAGLKE
jgi:hypothetical protein